MMRFREMPDFYKLVVANSASTLGDSASYLCVLLFVGAITKDTFSVVSLAILQALPRIFVGIFAGKVLDRLNKRSTLLRCEISSAVLCGFLALAVFNQSISWIFVLLFLKSSVNALYQPVKSALLPSIVTSSELGSGYSMLQTTTVIASVVGTALAGWIIAATNNYWIGIVVDGSSFLISYGFVYAISRRISAESLDEETEWRQAASGFTIIWRNKILLNALLITASLTFALEIYNVLYVPLISQVAQASPLWFSIVEAVQAVAVVLSGVIFAAWVTAKTDLQKIVLCSALVLAVAIFSMGLSHNIYVLLALFFLFGSTEIPLSSSLSTLIQKELSDSIRTRVAASINAIVALAEIGGLVLCGVLISRLGTQLLFLLSGAIMFLFIAVTKIPMFSKRERQVQSSLELPQIQSSLLNDTNR